MRLQLRLGDEAMQQEIEKRMQEEKDEVCYKICVCVLFDTLITYYYEIGIGTRNLYIC